MIGPENSVRVTIGPVYDNDKSRRKTNLLRQSDFTMLQKINYKESKTWRSFTKLQKYGLCMIGSVMVFLIYYSYHSTHPHIEELTKDTKHREHLMPQDVKNRLKDAINNAPSMKPIPISKKGPPKLLRAKTTLKTLLAVQDELIRNEVRSNQASKQAFVSKGGNLELNPERITQTERQKAVVSAFKHAWKAYKDYAWGHDELKPISKEYSEWFHLGLTIIDSLDTMWLMNLKEDFNKAQRWVTESLSLDSPSDVNLFETTIRVLGGLLSTYHLSGQKIFLTKANSLGERLLGAFQTSSGIPFSDVNLVLRKGRPPSWSSDSSLSEVTTIQLEFKDLYKSTGTKKFYDVTDNVMEKVFKLHRPGGLCPIHINPNSGEFRGGDTITLGARGDSYYEYLLKQWLQSGKKDSRFKEKYLEAVQGIKSILVRQSSPHKLTYVGELLNGRNFSPKMDHLVCFLPGTLALGYYNGLPRDHMDLAEKLIETCYAMYEEMPTGLSPEIVYFNTGNTNPGDKDIVVHSLDRHNLLRPETVESLYIMYKITKNKKYQEYGWKIFQAFEKYTKVEDGGYSSINNVMDPQNPNFRDKMESFFLGETLKYLYLLFTDEDIIPLDKYVFNTEAHPLPIW